MVIVEVISPMPLQVRSAATSIIFPNSVHSKTRHHHQTTETPSRRQSEAQLHHHHHHQIQIQIQIQHPLPPLLQKPHRLFPSSYSSPSSTPPTSKSSITDILRLMDSLHLPIEPDTYASLLHECALSADLLQGSAVHSHITRTFSLLRHPKGLFLANRLLFMYASCGHAKLARQLFDQMPLTDSVSRVITITALSNNNDDVGALRLFAGMHPGREGWWLVDPLGFRVVLWACARAGDLGLGRQLHGLAVKLTGCCSSFAAAPLIKFYAMVGCPDLSLQLMSASRSDDCEEAALVSIVSAYSKGGCFRKAMLVFREMERRRGVGGYLKRKRRMLASILAACAGANEEKEACEGGRQVHAIAVKIGVDGDTYVGCGLVELYSKRGQLVEARRAFETVGCGGGRRDAAFWNAMFGGYSRGGSDAETLLFVQEMRAAGIEPPVSYSESSLVRL